MRISPLLTSTSANNHRSTQNSRFTNMPGPTYINGASDISFYGGCNTKTKLAKKLKKAFIKAGEEAKKKAEEPKMANDSPTAEEAWERAVEFRAYVANT